MYKAEIIDDKPVVIFDGEIIEEGFDWLCLAQERAAELNEDLESK